MIERYCSNCGKEIIENSNFCMYCGKKLTKNNDDEIANSQEKKDSLLKIRLLKIFSCILAVLSGVFIFGGIQYNQTESAKMDMLIGRKHIFGSSGATEIITYGLIFITTAIILYIIAIKLSPKKK